MEVWFWIILGVAFFLVAAVVFLWCMFGAAADEYERLEKQIERQYERRKELASEWCDQANDIRAAANVWHDQIDQDARDLLRSVGAPRPWGLNDHSDSFQCKQCMTTLVIGERGIDYTISMGSGIKRPKYISHDSLLDRYREALTHARWHASLVVKEPIVKGIRDDAMVADVIADLFGESTGENVD